ncbi:MAG: NAD(P)-dependent oxidoreductase [Actinomycetes bacterium]
MDIGFVGLGIMGRPMARNLLAAGHSVTVVSRSPGPVAELVVEGAVAAEGLAELAAGRDAVVTMLPDSTDVEAVVLGPGGVLDHADPGTLLIDMSTVHPSTARALAREAASRGCRALDAPVSGGDVGAAAGTLAIMVGGDAAAFTAALPLLEVLGTTVRRVGPAGAGQTVKAANQLLVGGTLAVLGEAIGLLEAAGVDPTEALEVLGAGMAQSRILERKGPQMIERSFEPGFRVDLHAKDLRIATDTARDLGVAVPVGESVGRLLEALDAAGGGGLDHTALVLGVTGDGPLGAAPPTG